MSNANRWRPVPAHQVDYADLIQAIRDELNPVQNKLEELTKQVNQLAQGAVTRVDLAEVRTEMTSTMTRIEGHYYSKELIDAKLGLIDSAIRGVQGKIDGLSTQITELNQRPARALNFWVGVAAVIGGGIGVLSFLIQHLGIH